MNIKHKFPGSRIVLVSALLVASYVSMNASTASGEPALSASGATYRCVSSLTCDVTHATPPSTNYSRVCPRTTCDITAVLDWENVSLPTSPTLAQAHAAYAANPFNANTGLRGISTLLGRWTKVSIAGRTASMVSRIGVAKSSIESVVFHTGSIIAMLHSRAAAVVANERYQGFIPVVVSGFTPVGPMVTLNGRTTQMSWMQWGKQAVGAWSVAVRSSNPVASTGGTIATPVATTVTITFNSNDGTGATTSETTPANTPIALTPNPFVLQGQTFNGWNTATDGSGTPYANSSTYSFTQSITLYAQWETPLASAAYTTPNWSGFVSSGIPATNASGSWTVPTLNCSGGTDTYVAEWVGIGGFTLNSVSSGALLQTGTAAVCDGSMQVNLTWWEDYPNMPIFSGFNMTVSAGDSMSASVYKTNGTWETVVSDLTTGVSGVAIVGGSWGTTPTANGTTVVSSPSGSTSFTYDGGTSAEWIVEDLMSSSALTSFANYGSTTFSNLEMNSAPWYPQNADSVAIVQNGVVLSTPTKIDANGFTTSYQG